MTPEMTTLLIGGMTLVGGVVGWFAKIAIAAMSKKSPINIGSDQCVRLIRGYVYEHEVNCRNLGQVLARMENMERVVRTDLQSYREELGRRLDNIDAKLDRHIEKGG